MCSRHAEGGCFVLLFPLLDVCSVSTSAVTIVVGDYCGGGVVVPKYFYERSMALRGRVKNPASSHTITECVAACGNRFSYVARAGDISPHAQWKRPPTCGQYFTFMYV